MGNRRRNLIVLVLVLALLAGVAGRDHDQADGARPRPARRHRARLPGPPDPAGPERHAGRHRPRDRDHPRARRHARRLRARDLARRRDQIEVGLPDVQDAERAIDQIGTTAQLYLYDFEPNVIPPNPEPPERDRAPLQPADRRGRGGLEAKPECFKNDCTTNGPTYYLFDKDTLEPLGDPSEKKQDLFLALPGRQAAPELEVVDGPAGDDRGRPRSRRTTRPPTPTRRPAGTASYFVLRDRPALTGERDHRSARQNIDPTTNQPNVTFDFTDEGRTAFQNVTREIAQRGSEPVRSPPGTPVSSISSNDASALSGSFAIVLDNVDRVAADHQLQREPGRDRRPHRAPRSRAPSPSRRPRTSPRSSRSARCRSSSA